MKHKLWAIGGGKGGVGKSVVSLMLGTILTRKGKSVILVDADLGGSNLHALCGIKYPIYTLADFIQRRVDNIEDVTMLTPIDNLRIICGADDVLGLANPKHTQKERLFNHLKRLDADIILFDLGAGTSYTTMDFFLYAPNKIVVFTPQITSIQNAYGFIKASLSRLLVRTFGKADNYYEIISQFTSPENNGSIDSMTKLREAFMALGPEHYAKLTKCMEDLNVGLIVNMVREKNESEVGHILQDVTANHLGVSPEYLGFINHDRVLESSINNMTKYLSESMDGRAGACFYDIASKILIRNRKPQVADADPAYSRAR